MANNTQYNCVAGQSFTDVCLNIYGSLDYYIKMLNDNSVQPDDVPYTGQVIMYDNTLINNQSVTTTIRNNNIIYATFTGYGIPEQQNPIMTTYSEVFPVNYTATADNTTTFSLPVLVSAVVVSVIMETKPLTPDLYYIDPATGNGNLLNGVSLATGQTLFILYKKIITN